ncbi:MAG TPA: sterol desaturase family protein [Polyangiaceae bacterium]|jgi:sterol desaturase/sphingolipid hydroxylase (fatty acid hydroxylase superfamily)|nr:sterol desaturase family protein [Polyangiaceae bacterium]
MVQAVSRPPDDDEPRVSGAFDAFQASRDRTRARALAGRPRFYSPYLHLLGTTGIGLVTLAVAGFSIHHLRGVELGIVPALLLISNAVEWYAHKTMLHRRRWPVEVLYDRHTPQHHVIYQYDSMAIRSVDEFRLVLIPAVGVAAVVVAAAPLAYAASRLLTPNCGWLSLSTSALYMVTYELSHLSYHLPEDSFVGRRPLIRALREHHRRHHHTALMQRWNFNVTLPLFDWIFRTSVPDALVRKVSAD